MDNFIQEEIFEANLPAVRAQASKPTSEVRIPPTEIAGGAEVRVIKSSRRRRSISAYREHGAIVIQVPARLSNSKIQEVIPEMVEKILSREAREKMSDKALFDRALELFNQYLPEFRVRPVSVVWRSMNERWGSCTTLDRTIRISDRLNGAPSYVVDYLLLHELIHLEIPDHGGEFEKLLARFEESEMANAYLDGYEAGTRG
ncbi:MAG: M48 family metallopeptidase [Actinobacteria bacterium]|nr:M48 family metallopeptidase [Actinomycetota bacterium]